MVFGQQSTYKQWQNKFCVVSYGKQTSTQRSWQHSNRTHYDKVRLKFVIDENLYWNANVDYVCASLVTYFGICNHIKPFITLRIAWQLYFAFINSHINYGIEVYGHCVNDYLSKLQMLQSRLLNLMLRWDPLHRGLLLLKVSDIHDVNVLCFVNNCRAARCPETFCTKFGKQNVTFVTITTLMNHWLDLKRVLAHVTSKELDFI